MLIDYTFKQIALKSLLLTQDLYRRKKKKSETKLNKNVCSSVSCLGQRTLASELILHVQTSRLLQIMEKPDEHRRCIQTAQYSCYEEASSASKNSFPERSYQVFGNVYERSHKAGTAGLLYCWVLQHK